MNQAPLFPEAMGPDDGQAFFVKSADGVQLRLGAWRHDGAAGTVLLVPGRTEYIEKYAPAAGDLRARGFATLVIDLRGQGLADRPLGDRLTGHVGDFAEYQLDIDAMLTFARAQGLPEPYFMLSHSMGGAIALRAVTRGLGIKAVAFSAPMWGISIAAWLRPAAMAIATMSRWLRLDSKYLPGTGAKTYVLSQPFLGNSLTSDPEMWRFMQAQATAHPELTLGGPSLGWLHAALAECNALATLPAPALPCYTALGTQEKIIDVAPIHLRMAGWQSGELQMFSGAEHEVMMESTNSRAAFYDKVANLFHASK